MALITRRICDHLANHQDGPVEGSESTYTVNGVTVKLDECDPCRKPFVEAFEALREIGRSTAAPAPPKRRWHPAPNDGLERPFVCEFCNKAKYTTLGRLAPHVARQHKDENAAWRERMGLQ